MVEKIERLGEAFINAVSKLPDNVWAFLLFLVAAGIALQAHHSVDQALMQFARDCAMTGAALFHSKEKKD